MSVSVDWVPMDVVLGLRVGFDQFEEIILLIYFAKWKRKILLH